MIIFDFNLISALVAASLTVFLGILVFVHDRHSVTNKIFIIHALVGAGWAFINYFSLIASPETTLFWIRLVIFFAVPHVFLFLLFVLNFPGKKLQLNKGLFTITILLAILLMALTQTTYIFATMSTGVKGLTPQPGVFMPFFGSTLVAFFLLTVILVIYKYFKADTEIKRPWLTIGSGLLISYSLLIFFVFLKVILANDTTFVRYSPLFILPIFLSAGYAILKHHLFNIKLIRTETVILVLLLVSFIQVIIAPNAMAKTLALSVTAFILITSILLIKSVLREVQQREQLEILDKELQEANVKLKALDQARAEFITIASHQLRTPPATIKWYLSSVLDGDYGKLKQDQKEILEKTNRTNNSLISLVDDMLNVSRIERGKMEFLFEQVSLLDLAKTTFEQLEPIAKDKKLTLTFKYSPKTKFPKLMADKEKIRQVMNNLIDNALKYTKQGTVAVNIMASKDEIKFSVTDSGKGIAPEEQISIFEKYTRGKESIKQSAGLGLGLYVAKIIVGQHKGKIWAESSGEGKGSTFAFTVPINNELKETTLVDLAKNQG